MAHVAGMGFGIGGAEAQLVSHFGRVGRVRRSGRTKCSIRPSSNCWLPRRTQPRRHRPARIGGRRGGQPTRQSPLPEGSTALGSMPPWRRTAARPPRRRPPRGAVRRLGQRLLAGPLPTTRRAHSRQTLCTPRCGTARAWQQQAELPRDPRPLGLPRVAVLAVPGDRAAPRLIRCRSGLGIFLEFSARECRVLLNHRELLPPGIDIDLRFLHAVLEASIFDAEDCLTFLDVAAVLESPLDPDNPAADLRSNINFRTGPHHSRTVHGDGTGAGHG